MGDGYTIDEKDTFFEDMKRLTNDMVTRKKKKEALKLILICSFNITHSFDETKKEREKKTSLF